MKIGKIERMLLETVATQTLTLGVFMDAGSDDNRIDTFLRGSVVFDLTLGQVSFGAVHPVSALFPADLPIREGQSVFLRLFDADGKPKRKRDGADQVRLIVLHHPAKTVKGKHGEPDRLEVSRHLLMATGEKSSPKHFSEADNWHPRVFKFRVYETHQGIPTTPMPDAFRDSFVRQHRFAHNLAVALKITRRKCSTVTEEQLTAFRDRVLLPQLEAFNASRGKQPKIKYPRFLTADGRKERPEMSHLLSLAKTLETLAETGKPAPEGLAAAIRAFAAEHPVDYAPINDFQRNIAAHIEEQAELLQMTSSERARMAQRLLKTLERRRTNKLPPHKGWPQPRYDEDMLARFQTGCKPTPAGIPTSILFEPAMSGKNYIGLPVTTNIYIGPSVPHHLTGHDKMFTHPVTGKPTATSRRATGRQLRPVTLSLPSPKKADKAFWTLALLLDREIPTEGAYFKSWELVRDKDKRIFLCLTFLLHTPPATQPASGELGSAVAGLDIGWYRSGDRIRIGMLYDPVAKARRAITVDLTQSGQHCGDHNPTSRPRFHVAVGMSRWGRRNVQRSTEFEQRFAPRRQQLCELVGVSASDNGQPLSANEVMLRLCQALTQRTALEANNAPMPVASAANFFEELLGASDCFAFTDDFAGMMAVRQRRDALKDLAKTLLIVALAEHCPPWLYNPKVGIRGLSKALADTAAYNPFAQVFDHWAATDSLFLHQLNFISERVAQRIRKAHRLLANDICSALAESGIMALAFEKHFLKKLQELPMDISADEDASVAYAVRNSAKYRSLVALGKFVDVVKETLTKKGMAAIEVEGQYTTSTCSNCGAQNKVGPKRRFTCVQCLEQHDQDENAAINIARQGMQQSAATEVGVVQSL